MRSLTRARRLLGRLAGRGRPLAVILAYHRVARPATDPFGLAVGPDRFSEQMQVLRREASPLSLQDLIAALRRDAVPRRAVVVTFDDGYADNLIAARPVLDKREIPATFFIASGRLGNTGGFWWDHLGRLLLSPGTLPDRLELPLPWGTFRHALRAARELSEADATRSASWVTPSGGRPPTPRHRFYLRLYSHLQCLAPDAQDHAMRALHAWAGVEPSRSEADRTMTADELARLADADHIKIGGHTRQHPMLSRVPPEAQRREIAEGKAWLEERLGRTLEHFSYPYGATSALTPSIVQEVGFVAACTTEPRGVDPWDAPYLLPRICPGDWDGEEFARRLRGWFAG